jgi:hypothetical protein
MSQAAPRGADMAYDDADCWKEAARLRREHPGWVVIWLASTREYRAYRLSQARRDIALTAQVPEGLETQIRQVERPSGTSLVTRRRDPHDRSGPGPARPADHSPAIPSQTEHGHD